MKLSDVEAALCLIALYALATLLPALLSWGGAR